MYDLAKKSIGIDVLLDQQESGVAHDKRLEVLEDWLRDLGLGLFSMVQKHFWFVENLLQFDQNARTEPVIKIPESYKIRDAETLLKGVKESIVSDRYLSTIRYIERKYSSDPIIQKVYEVAYRWSPLLLYADDPAQLQLRMLAYDSSEVIKMDKAIIIIKRNSARDGR